MGSRPSLDAESPEGFFTRYGAALSAGDTARIAACWELPALVVADQGGLAVSSAEQVEAFFGEAVRWYRSRGVVAVAPVRIETAQLSGRVYSAAVSWVERDTMGKDSPSDRTAYLLRRGDDGQLRIVSTVVLDDTLGARAPFGRNPVRGH